LVSTLANRSRCYHEQPISRRHVRLVAAERNDRCEGNIVGGVVVRAKTSDLAGAGLLASDLPKCVQCRRPMKLELGEPVGGISDTVVLTVKCPSCGAAKKIKRRRAAAQVFRAMNAR
jgi:hypothetical protein